MRSLARFACKRILDSIIALVRSDTVNTDGEPMIISKNVTPPDLQQVDQTDMSAVVPGVIDRRLTKYRTMQD